MTHFTCKHEQDNPTRIPTECGWDSEQDQGVKTQKVSVSQTKAVNQSCQSHVIPVIHVCRVSHVIDPWDMLNNFCFPV